MTVQIDQTDIMLVDADYLAHRAYYAFTDEKNPAATLRTTQGVESGCFFGFFSLLLRKIRDLSPRTIIICWGDKRGNLLRRKMYPPYKAERDKKDTPSAFSSQMVDIKSALSALGFVQYLQEGYEGDDIIAHFANLHKQTPNMNMCIISGDKDLTQLVTSNIVTISLAAGFVKRDFEYNEETVRAKFGVPPALIDDYLVLIGDDADGIIGVDGIGPKTAAKILNENGQIGDWFNNIDSLKVSPKIRQKLKDARRQLIINKQLIMLKSVHFPAIYPFSSGVDFNKERAVALFDYYEMRKIRPEDFCGQ